MKYYSTYPFRYASQVLAGKPSYFNTFASFLRARQG